MSKVYKRIDGKCSMWERSYYNDKILRYVVTNVDGKQIFECDNFADAYRFYNDVK